MSASIKRLLRGKLTIWLAGEAAVSYGEPARDLERDHVWLGKIGGPMRLLTFKPAGRPIARESDLRVPIYIRAAGIGDGTEASDERAEEIGDLIIAGFASDPTLGGQVLLAQVVETDLEAGINDDGAISVNTLTVAVKAHLA